MSAVERRPLGSTEQVAAYLQVSPRTLDDWAYRGTGPRFSRVGKHRRYRWPDVEQWLEAQSSEAMA